MGRHGKGERGHKRWPDQRGAKRDCQHCGRQGREAMARTDHDEPAGKQRERDGRQRQIADQGGKRSHQRELYRDGDDAGRGQHDTDLDRAERLAMPLKTRIEDQRQLRGEQAEREIEDREQHEQLLDPGDAARARS